MRFNELFKAIFGYTVTPAPLPRPAFDQQAYVAKHLAEITEAAEHFRQRYSSDFNAFFYRPNVTSFITQEVVPFLYPSPDERYREKYNSFLDVSHWPIRNTFNFPGPFYTGESDSCGTGECEAPANVLNDHDYYEVVFRQPQNFEEFLCLLSAAAVETFSSYSCDGNDHWTYQLCREWWRGKDEIIRRLQTPAFQENNGDRVQLYVDYLNGAAEADLRNYCYFLEHGHYPTAGVALPLLYPYGFVAAGAASAPPGRW